MLHAIEKGVSFIPNLMGTFAHSPALLARILAFHGGTDLCAHRRLRLAHKYLCASRLAQEILVPGRGLEPDLK
jgi:hypothetical protein